MTQAQSHFAFWLKIEEPVVPQTYSYIMRPPWIIFAWNDYISVATSLTYLYQRLSCMYSVFHLKNCSFLFMSFKIFFCRKNLAKKVIATKASLVSQQDIQNEMTLSPRCLFENWKVLKDLDEAFEDDRTEIIRNHSRNKEKNTAQGLCISVL